MGVQRSFPLDTSQVACSARAAKGSSIWRGYALYEKGELIEVFMYCKGAARRRAIRAGLVHALWTSINHL